MPQEFWSNAIYSVTPTILIGLVFWFALRAIIRADRTERSAYAKVEAEERARRGMALPSTTAQTTAAQTTAAQTTTAAVPMSPDAAAASPVAEATREL